MNKPRLILGIVFLALAVLLVVLNQILPAEDLMFAVGDQNLPWVPVVILAVLGVAFLAAAPRGQKGA